MDIRKAFVASSYLLVLTGILSLSIAEGSPGIILLATVLCFIAYQVAERMGRPLGRLGTNFAVAGVIGLIPFDYTLVTGDVVITATHFLLAVQIVKLFGEKATRDYVQLFAVSLIHLGVAAVVTIELLFSAAFVIYLIVATWTLCLFLLHRELEENARQEPGRIRSGRGLLGSTAVASVASLVLTIVVFFLFPRFSAVIFDVKRQRSTARVAGFTDEIGLTDLSEIRGNSEIVLRIQVERKGDRLPLEPKWRGLAFDRYEEGKWTRSWVVRGASPTPSIRALPVRESGGAAGAVAWTIKRPARPRPLEEAEAIYTIWQTPLGIDSNVLFGVPTIEHVRFESNDRPSDLVIDKGDALIGVGLPSSDVKYRVRSTPPRRAAALGAAVDIAPDRTGIDWLQLPAAPTLTARLKELSDTVIADARAQTPLEKAEALERYLATQYMYTLDLTRPPEGGDPILHFLFTTKEGHCELSATAFVLMCRTQGIPARLVNGFQTGQWNDLGGYYQVRQMEAHAWAEVRFAGEAGWIDFDPTPWLGAGSGGILGSLEKMQDYLQLRWLNYVISWSQSDQLSAANQLKRTVEEWKRAFLRKLESWKDLIPRLSREEIAERLIYAALFGATAFALALYFGTRRGARKNGAARARASRRVPFYEEWSRAVEKRGFRRRPEETPLEHARRVEKEAGPALAGASALVAAFYRVRFAEADLSPAEESQVQALVAAAARPETQAPRA